MKKLKSFAKRTVRTAKNQAGQGMAEYVLLIVVVLSIAFLFKNNIKQIFSDKMADISGGMNGFKVEQ